MKPNGGGKIPGALEKALVDGFGSVEKAKEDLIAAGTAQFGSGWGWLAVVNGKVVATKTPNGESPLVHGGTPILGVDVWEHSYYIDYRNRRPDYLKAFVENLVNWEYVAGDSTTAAATSVGDHVDRPGAVAGPCESSVRLIVLSLQRSTPVCRCRPRRRIAP